MTLTCLSCDRPMTREGRAFWCEPCRQFVVFFRSADLPNEASIGEGFADQLLILDRARRGILPVVTDKVPSRASMD